ncbi:MAG TPA: ABC transporter permease [Gammaproteobacteria bacterium]|nr:ABC transporter permease [Gammaproteobacteria bacterium]
MSFKHFSIGTALFILLLYGGLITSLLYYLDPAQFLAAITSQRALAAISLSLAAASIATVLAVLIAIPAAYALSRYSFRGKEIVDTLLELPIIVSPAALGAMLLIFFTNPLGNWLQTHTVQFVFAFAGVVLAQFITTVGIATRFIKTAIDDVPGRYESVGRTLGATPWQAFITLTVPLARKGIIAATVLTWAKAMGEFGATITLAGTMAMRTETLPVAIYMHLASADIEGTVVLIFVMLSIGLGTLYGVRKLGRRGRRA